jgi:hypothetical protein
LRSLLFESTSKGFFCIMRGGLFAENPFESFDLGVPAWLGIKPGTFANLR